MERLNNLSKAIMNIVSNATVNCMRMMTEDPLNKPKQLLMNDQDCQRKSMDLVTMNPREMIACSMGEIMVTKPLRLP